MDFPGGASGKEPACQCRLDIKDMGSIPGLEIAPRGGHGNPLKYSCLENPMDKGAWWAAVHRIAQSWHVWSNLAHMHKLHNSLYFLIPYPYIATPCFPLPTDIH